MEPIQQPLQNLKCLNLRKTSEIAFFIFINWKLNLHVTLSKMGVSCVQPPQASESEGEVTKFDSLKLLLNGKKRQSFIYRHK